MVKTLVSDHDLVVAASFGEKDAWSALVDRFAQHVWEVVRRRGLDRDTAALVHHATWLDLADHIVGFADPGRVRDWLTDVASRKSEQALLPREMDRRLTSRLPATFPISLSPSGAADVIGGDCVDLSAGGLRGRTGVRRLAADTRLLLAIEADDHVIVTDARVASSSVRGRGGVDLHVEFLGLSGTRREALAGVLTSLTG